MNAHTDYNVMIVNTRGIHHRQCSTKVATILAVHSPGTKRAVITHPKWVGCLRVILGAHNTPDRIDSVAVGWANQPIPEDAQLLNKLLLN